MKLNYLIASIVILSLQLGMNVSAEMVRTTFKNEPDGFRDIKWGSPFSSHAKKMMPTRSDKYVKCYSRKEDKLAIGNARLAYIDYCYWRDQFYMVILESRDVRELMGAFQEKFGDDNNCIDTGRFSSECNWNGDITDIRLTCSSLGKENCKAVLWSHAMAYKVEEDKRKAAEGAAKDF